MRESLFSIDLLGERVFSGFTDGRNWNGWACPYFPFAQAQRLVQAWQENGWEAGYDAEQDAFRFAIADDAPDAEQDVEFFEAIEAAGLTLYPIGYANWIWDEITPSEAANTTVGA